MTGQLTMTLSGLTPKTKALPGPSGLAETTSPAATARCSSAKDVMRRTLPWAMAASVQATTWASHSGL